MNFSQIQFDTCPEQIDLSQLQELFALAAGLPKERRVEDLAIAIANSNPVLSVWDGKKMIGFARATSDGIYRAVIWDLVIHPDYQGVGLGQKLVETLLNHPRMNRVEKIYLMTSHQQQFYKQLGFQCNLSTTMVLSNQALNNSRRYKFLEHGLFVQNSFGQQPKKDSD